MSYVCGLCGKRVCYTENPNLSHGTITDVDKVDNIVEVQWDDGEKDWYEPEQITLVEESKESV